MQEDGALERELYPETAVKVDTKMPIEVRIQTSDIAGAGTDANVKLALYGDKGKTDDIIVANKTNNFERNMLESFKMDVQDVGTITKLRVGHDSKNMLSAWHLAWVRVDILQQIIIKPLQIEVANLKTGEVFRFEANRWLSKREGDKQTVIELPITSVQKMVGGKIVVVEKEQQDLVLYKASDVWCDVM